MPTPLTSGLVLRRAAPFVVVAALAESGAFLAPNVQIGYRLAPSAILLLIVGCSTALPWERLPPWPRVFPPLLYVLSTAALVAAVGRTEIEIVSVLLLPVIWTSLYQTRRHSMIIAAVTILVLMALSANRHYPVPVLAWGVVVWAGMAFVIATATHGLRDRLGRAIDDGAESARQADALSSAARQLTALTDPAQVTSVATRLMDDLLVPAAPASAGASYVRIAGGFAYLTIGGEESPAVIHSWPVREDPYLSEVVSSGKSLRAELDISRLLPEFQPAVKAAEVTHCAWIPVAPNGSLSGVLTVLGRNEPVSDKLFERATALGQIVQLAMANAVAYQTAREQAATDPLTGLANRRGFDLDVPGLRGRHRFACLMLDLDRLKQINDTHGHAAGDQALRTVGEAARLAVRRGDLVARVGGDEFLAFLADAGVETARQVSRRLLTRLGRATVQGSPIAASVGIACGDADSDIDEVARRADEAMYAAKTAGGARISIWSADTASRGAAVTP